MIDPGFESRHFTSEEVSTPILLTFFLKQTIFDRNSSYVFVDVINIAIFSHCAHYNIYLSEEKLL